ncbi:HAD hydrolase-like protein [archaeon]|jgi:FMN phosphatase YigB (HAD superfamily)|nr:HAD hydrolase-like protein [archaeon]MBT3731182.1 HAD hydrolase-like protein [archaeon]MBT4670064.1 HAD hydrolase-like protein [archaeon]MBT5030636.1 HAD hydrolase-like protein [archaeon]MBT5287988.1 HAD hydrolase-like protein [archaeon]
MKVILFDIGGVICEDIEKHMMKEISEEYKKDYSFVMKVRDKWWKLYACDKINEEEYWKGFLKDVGIEEDYSKFVKLPYERYIILKKGIISYIENLSKKYKLFIVSDHSKDWWNFANEKFKISEYFEEKYFSFDYKSLKIEGKLFEEVLKKVKSEDCLFIDNSKENLKIAQKFGIKGLYFENVDDLRNLLS